MATPHPAVLGALVLSLLAGGCIGAAGQTTVATPTGVDGPADCASTTRPPPRGYALTLTGPDGKVDLYTGFASSEWDALATDMGPRRDAWTFDAATGCWTDQGWAPFLTWGLAHDPSRNVLLGYDIFLDEGPPAAWPRSIAQPLSEVWLRSADGSWTQTLVPTILARSAPSIVFSPEIDRFVMFGGCYAAFACLDEVWTFSPDDGAWEQRMPDAGPIARNFAGMVHVPALDGILLFGGHHTGPGGVIRHLGDTWLYDPVENTWTSIVTSPAPSVRSYGHLTYVASEGRVYLFGGQSNRPLGDLWYFDVSDRSWHTVATDDGPSPRARHAVGYDAVAHALVVFGGGNNEDCPYWDETWVYHLGTGTWHNPDLRAPGEDPHPQTGLLCTFPAADQ